MEKYKTWLLSSEGRISRTQFWLGILLTLAIYLVGALVLFGIGGAAGSETVMYIMGIPFIALIIFLIWSQIALNNKRLHDLDKSGWFQLIYLIPVIGMVFIFYIGLAPAKPGPNRFGPNPKEI
jgi:uncharacterized membrane protein YhaH (DUF805 family)